MGRLDHELHANCLSVCVPDCRSCPPWYPFHPFRGWCHTPAGPTGTSPEKLGTRKTQFRGGFGKHCPMTQSPLARSCALLYISVPHEHYWRRMCPGPCQGVGAPAEVPLAGRLCKTDSPVGLVLSLSVWQRALLVQFPFNLFCSCLFSLIQTLPFLRGAYLSPLPAFRPIRKK